MIAVIKYKIKDKNQELHIFQDSNPESPDDWENDEIFLVYKHKDFTINRDGFICKEIYNYLNYLESIEDKNKFNYKEVIEKWEYNKGVNYSEYHIFTVYAHIHGGVSLSLNHNGDRWDTSSTGFILIKKDLLKGSSKNEENLTEEEARTNYVENLIKTWNQYLSGEVYGFKVFEQVETYTITKENLDNISSENNFINKSELIAESTKNIELEEIDSCWGFYGSDYEHIFDHLSLKLEELEEIK
jgi:hypothetical protein